MTIHYDERAYAGAAGGQTALAAAGGARGKIAMIGLRGIPNVEGGIEKHVEQLSRELTGKGWEVEVFARRPYVGQSQPFLWERVRVRPLWAPASRRFETASHTLLSLLVAARTRPDIVHIHAIGPSLVAPLARLLGLNVVVTHHGFDYDREKWSWMEKKVLRVCEWMGMKSAHSRIGVSRSIVESVTGRYRLPMSFVPNAVAIDETEVDTDILARFDLQPKRYVIMVGRLVDEKRQTDLIEAFNRVQHENGGVKLAIVGGGDLDTAYGRRLTTLAGANRNVSLTGTQTGADLATLYRNAQLFVLPSSHEGMPIVALEAAAYGIPVLMSNIPANLELNFGKDSYFSLGDVGALAELLRRNILEGANEVDIMRNRQRIEREFGWGTVSDRTIEVYEALLKQREQPRAVLAASRPGEGR